MDKIEELKRKIEGFQAKSAAKDEMKALITLVLGFLKRYKDYFDNISSENKKIINDTITYLQDINEEAIDTYRTKTDKVVNEFERNIATVKKLVAEVKATKPKDGRDGIDGIDGKDGIGIDGKDGSPDTRLEIIEKINAGKAKDLKIEFTQIDTTRLEKIIFDRAISILDQRTQFLINKGVKHDASLSGEGTDASPLTVVDNGNGGSGWTVETPTGSVNSVNTVFTVTAEPKCVVADGVTYFDGAGYTYAALSITMDIAPSQYIRDYI